jgi:hypothetical protein
MRSSRVSRRAMPSSSRAERASPPARQPGDAATLAHIVSAIMFLSMAATIHIARSVDEILEDIRSQARILLSH